MRAAPPFQVSLRRFGVWQGSVYGLCALDAATVAAWLMNQSSSLTWSRSLPVAAVTLLVAVLFGASLTKMRRADLRWDGRAWHLGAASQQPIAGDLSVAIDLGAWMLLRFVPEPSGARDPQNSRLRAVWLPVQRRGLESTWHALRCSVYSPRSAPADDTPLGF